MGITASSKGAGTFELCPEGTQQAVCCDIIDHGIVSVTYKGKPKQAHKVTIKWQSAEKMSDGRPYLVQKRYTLSLNEKANLRKDLESWRGRMFTTEEAEAFDLEEKLIGVNCFINVVHVRKPSGLWAEVMAVMPKPRSMANLVITGYVRMIDRPKTPPADPTAVGAAAAAQRVREPGDEPPIDVYDREPPMEIDSDDIPF